MQLTRKSFLLSLLAVPGALFSKFLPAKSITSFRKILVPSPIDLAVFDRAMVKALAELYEDMREQNGVPQEYFREDELEPWELRPRTTDHYHHIDGIEAHKKGIVPYIPGKQASGHLSTGKSLLWDEPSITIEPVELEA